MQLLEVSKCQISSSMTVKQSSELNVGGSEQRTANSHQRCTRQIFTFILLAFTYVLSFSQSSHKQLREGDLFYDQGEFLEAEEAYRKANAKTLNPQAQYNLGNAIYQQERYDEAIQYYESAAQQASDPLLKAQAYHNLGNTHFRAQVLDKSVEAYKNALKLNPNDIDTKKNLTMALQKLREQQQQQQRQQQQQGGQEKEEEQQQQEQEQQQQQQQQEQQQPQEQPQPQESSEDLTKEEAKELLRIIDEEDSKVQEKLRKTTANPKKPKKDW